MAGKPVRAGDRKGRPYGHMSPRICVGRDAHIAPSGRRRSHPCLVRAARVRVSGQRMAAQGRYESTAVDLRTWFAGRSASAWDMPQARKDFKTMGFGGVLWVLSAAVGRKYHAVGKTRGAVRGVLRIARGAVRPRNAMQFNKKAEAPNREPPFLLVTPSYRRAAPPARREPPSRW